MQLLSCGFDEKKREIREKIAEFEKAGKIEKVTYEKSLLDTL